MPHHVDLMWEISSISCGWLYTFRFIIFLIIKRNSYNLLCLEMYLPFKDGRAHGSVQGIYSVIKQRQDTWSYRMWISLHFLKQFLITFLKISFNVGLVGIQGNCSCVLITGRLQVSVKLKWNSNIFFFQQ